jgi:acarbose 7IV-phosphotransferase
MSKILVAGLINVETTLRVDGFPIEYRPQNFPFFGVRTTTSGVGYNVSKALTVLGNDVCFLSLIGADLNGEFVRASLAADGLEDQHILAVMAETPQSVILYDPAGRREIYSDLKDIQERAYPLERFRALAGHCDLLALCNINFARALLHEGKRLGKPIATDVHAIAALDDDFNHDFMATADILFMSHERLPAPPEAWAAAVVGRYRPKVLVVGLGAEGALLAVPDDAFMARFPAAKSRPVVNTVGAGDALYSCFLHGYVATGDPYRALRQAIVFASWKVGGNGGADGFLDAGALARLTG